MVSKKVTRVLSGIMAFLMILSVLPVNLFAVQTAAEEIAETKSVAVTVVTDDSSKAPIQGASVSVKDGDTVTTDADGKAELAALTVGQTYELTVACEGYTEKSFTVVVGEEAVTVALARSKHDILVSVVNGEDPVKDASVKLGDDTKGTTDSIGQVLLQGLTYGESYDLNVECTGFEPENMTLNCDKDAIKDGITVKMDKRKLSLVLSVTDKEGKALSDVEVHIGSSSCGKTDEEGKITLNELVYGEEYTVSAKLEGYAPGTAKFTCKDSATPSIKLTPYTKITVSGTVTCEGAAADDANVTLNLTEGMPLNVNTDSKGKFSFENVYKELVQSITVTGVPYKESEVKDVKEKNNISVERKTFKIQTSKINADDVGKVKASADEVKYGDSVEITVETVEQQGGRSSYSIYQIIDNDKIVMEDASGETSCTYTIKEVKEDHNITVTFNKDHEVLTFWVDADGQVYYEENDKYIKTDAWRLGNLKVTAETIVDEQTKEETKSVKIAYKPAKNFRVTTVQVGNGAVTDIFFDNDFAYKEASVTALEEGEMRKYVIEVQPNHFAVKLDKTVTDEVKGAITMDKDVLFGRDAKLTFAIPKEQYVSKLTVRGTGTDSESTSLKIDYSGEKPMAEIHNIREDKVVYAEFTDIKALKGENAKAALNVETIGNVFQTENAGADVYYLDTDAGIEISAAAGLISWTDSENFCEKLTVSDERTIETVYVLNDGVITKVNHTIQTVIDKDAPLISDQSSDATVDETNKKVTAITWTIAAEDNANGCGVKSVVYSTDSNLSTDSIRALAETAKADDNGDGTYSHSFENDRATYYFWAIDNLGHISEISKECYVDSDTDAPEVKFDFKGFRTFNGKNYPIKDGVVFTANVTDKLSEIETVVLQIGDTFTKDMKQTDDAGKYTVTVTPAEFNKVMESDENQELEVSVVATDNSDNKNASEPKVHEDKLIFEENRPVVSAAIPQGSPEAVDVNGVNWYQVVGDNKTDATLEITIKDPDSGLNSIDVVDKELDVENGEDEVDGTFKYKFDYYVEGKDTVYEYFPAAEKVVKAVLTINADGTENKLANFDFEITAIDNEGNKKVYVSQKPDTQKPDTQNQDILNNYEENTALKFSIDGIKPVVEKFDLVPNQADVYSSATENDYLDQANTDVEAKDYGYFFRRAAKVKVYVSDIGSQVKTIGFFKIAHDAENSEDVITTEPEGVSDGRWYAEFDVEEGFKGQIYAYAIDNVDNSNLVANPSENAHPENLTITESQVSHNKTTHITQELPETELKDAAGTRLYTMVKEENAVAYESGVPVEITVSDSFNGISSITYSVNSDEDSGKNIKETTITHDQFKKAEEGSNLTYTDTNNITWTAKETDKNLLTEICATIYVTNNSNDIAVAIDMKDMANNISKDEICLSIDNTLPVIEFKHVAVDKKAAGPTDTDEITSIGETPYFVGFQTKERKDSKPYPLYEQNTTLQIKIIERNLTKDEKNLIAQKLLTLKADKINELENLKKVKTKDLTASLKFFGPYVDDSDGVRKDAKYPFSDDTYYLIELRDCKEDAKGGTYETELTVKDLANHSNTGKEVFVTDTTAPTISISFDNNRAQNAIYYNSHRTATITVVERNFNHKSGTIDGVATDDGKKVEFPTIQASSWQTEDDFMTHTATVPFAVDAFYEDFTAYYTDLAGHNAKAGTHDFYVDTTMPDLYISGVEDKSANNGTVAPHITYSDTNLDKKSIVITLTGANNGVVDYAAVKQNIKNGENYFYSDFAYEKGVDDVYTLYARVTDMAGNSVTKSIRFSCNRFGSVFDLSLIEDMLGKFNQKERAIVVTETNVDELDMDAVRVTLTKNGTPVDLRPGKDFTVKMIGSEGTWHQYIYNIISNLFADDGTYSLYFYTEDVAGNINENIDDAKDAQVSFGIDKTKPIATPVDFVSDAQYAVESKTVSVEIKDNLLLEGVKVYLNNQEINYTVEGDNYIFDIPMSNAKQTVRIVAVDAAGNEEELLVRDFLVTTNFFVRWYNNVPLFIGSMVAMALILILLIWRIYVLLAKKDKYEEG